MSSSLRRPKLPYQLSRYNVSFHQDFMASEAARQQAQAEKLTLLVADNSSGYFGVVHLANQAGQRKPYQAQVTRGGKRAILGYFAAAEEAALCVARSPEGKAAAGRTATTESQGTLPAVPPGAVFKEEGTVPPMPLDAFVKVEVVVKEEEGCEGRPKRQRAK